MSSVLLSLSLSMFAVAQVGRVSHSYSMCVVSHEYGGLGGGSAGCGVSHACRTNSREFVACLKMLEHFLIAM